MVQVRCVVLHLYLFQCGCVERTERAHAGREHRGGGPLSRGRDLRNLQVRPFRS